MAEFNKIYKCEMCGNIVQVLHEGPADLVCCEEPMVQLEEQTADATVEKHVPVIEKLGDNKYLVKVGSVPHPMEDEHYIEWIELLADGVSYRKYLNPGDTPEAVFELAAGEVYAREYCNVHSLWLGQG